MTGCPHVWAEMTTGSGTNVVASLPVVVFCFICGVVSESQKEDERRFSLTTDPETGARYLSCRRRAIARTIAVADTVLVDLDGAGEVVGVELLGTS